MAQEQGQETTFLSEQGIRVTNTRFILPKQTFAMSGITSVQSHEEKPSKAGPIIFFIVGALVIAGGGDAIYFGVIMLIIGGIWLAVRKTTYHVLLHTASGEAKALSSKDGAWISKVVHALNDSIIHRG